MPLKLKEIFELILLFKKFRSALYKAQCSEQCSMNTTSPKLANHISYMHEKQKHRIKIDKYLCVSVAGDS